MLIPSIDLMGGKVVQLVQGKKKVLEFNDFQPWVERFSKYPLVQLIDLDAAMGQGNNSGLVREIAHQLPCQVGGGIRSIEAARKHGKWWGTTTATPEKAQRALDLGARMVVAGGDHGALVNGMRDSFRDFGSIAIPS